MTDSERQHVNDLLARALWRIYNRPERPTPWEGGGNLPWDEPDFSRRMLREHLDESHSAASRTSEQRALVIDWLWRKLRLAPGVRLLDVTCGPGLYAVPLAGRGLVVTGVDFAPAAIAHARQLADLAGVEHCYFHEADVREFDFGAAGFDAALFLYGQLAVFPRRQAQELLVRVAKALRPGGRLCVELLDQEKVDKSESNWWFSDDTGLWGDDPFFSFGERFWMEEEALSCERFYTLRLETGELEEVLLCDQTYSVREMTEMMLRAGFTTVDVYPHWDDVPQYDADEWNVYVAFK